MVVSGGEAPLISVLVPQGSLQPGAMLPLPESESHHLRVRRAAVGSPLRLQDGAGVTAEAVLVSTGGNAEVRVDSVCQHQPPMPLHLVVGAGDRDRFEWLAEKSAEFGVTELVPMATSWSESVASRVRPSHLERIARRAREATKQSGAPWAPTVAALATPEEVRDRFREGRRWLADAGGTVPIVDAEMATTVVIGPEGGLTNAERELFIAAGFEPVRLGPYLLRFETAALAAAALVRSAERGGT